MIEYLENYENNIIEVKSSSKLLRDEYLTISSNLRKALINWSEVNIIHDVSELKSVEKLVIINEIKFLIKNRLLVKAKVNKYALICDGIIKGKTLKVLLSPFISKICLYKSDEKLKAYAWIKL